MTLDPDCFMLSVIIICSVLLGRMLWCHLSNTKRCFNYYKGKYFYLLQLSKIFEAKTCVTETGKAFKISPSRPNFWCLSYLSETYLRSKTNLSLTTEENTCIHYNFQTFWGWDMSRWDMTGIKHLYFYHFGQYLTAHAYLFFY